MELFDRFYVRLGFNRPGHFYNPVVIKSDTFVFPLYSEVYNFKVTDAAEGVSKTGIFTRADKVVVRTAFKYEGNTEGRYRLPAANNNLLIADLSKKNPDVKYLRDSGQAAINITKSTLFVHNYGCLTNRYDYIKNEYVNKWKFHNAMVTLVEDINKANEKNHFVVLELPERLLDFHRLNLIASNLTLSKIRQLENYKYFTLIELWKFFTPELKESSLFNLIDKDKRIKVNILFTTFNGVHITNLGVLESIVKEYNEGVSKESFISNYTPETFQDLKNVFDCNLYYNTDNSNFNISTEEARMRSKLELKAKTFLKLFYIYLNNIINAGTDNEVKGTTSGVMINADDDLKNYEKMDNDDVITNNNRLDEELERQIESSAPSTDVDDEVIVNGEEEDNEDSNFATAVLEETVTDNKKYKSVEEVLNDVDDDPKTKLLNNIDVLRDNGVISKIVMNNMKEKVNQDVILSRVDRDGNTQNIKIEEFIKTKPELKIDKTENNIEDNKTVFDKTYNSNMVNVLDKHYIKNNYLQDIVRTIYSMEKSLVVIEDYNIVPTDNKDDVEIHTIKIKPLNGASSTIRFYLPKPNEDGTFVLSENTYRMRKQRQQIPIYKVSPTQVALNSYYGKVFINKAIKKVYSYGYWLYKHLLKMDNVSNVTPGELDVPDVKLFKLYGDIARGIKFFDMTLENEKKEVRVLRFSFDYVSRYNFIELTDEDLIKLENDDRIIVGESLTFVTKDKPEVDIILLSKDGTLSLADKKMVIREFDNFYNLLGITEFSGPVEFATLKILKEHVPIGLILGYYMGLDNLLESINVKYAIIDNKNRKEIKGYLEQGYYSIKFANKTVVVSRDKGIGDLILSGLVSIKELSSMNFEIFLNKTSYLTVFNNLNYPSVYVKEIKIMEDMFIDPMTRDVLEDLKLPLTFKGLLIKGCEMLIDDTHSRHNNIEGQMIKGYERVSGMVYKALTRAIREHENRIAFSKSKIIVDPYSVISKIKEDNTTIQLDDINPMAIIKTAGEVSYLGDGGRAIETMTKETRVRSSSEIGVFSESVKDNGDVAVLSNLVPNVNIGNIRGVVTEQKDIGAGWGDILSPTALLAPFSTFDDGKRINFISIMAGHVVPINDMKVPRIRTGYESIVPVTSSDKYAITAEMDGVVKSVNNKEIVVSYSNKTTKSYRLIKWTTKEESHSCYTHQLVTNLKAGQKFKKDDTIAFDNVFFEPDIFNPNRVLYKQGTYINTAIVENTETYEDSGALSSKVCERLGTKCTKVHSIVINCTDVLSNVLNIGDSVDYNTPMFSFISKEASDVSGFDKETIAILKDLNSSSPKAKAQGKIDNYVIRYNCEKKEMSKSLLAMVEASDERLKHNRGSDGRVQSNYSVRGKPLLPGEVEIKVYIEVNEGMGIGDKGIFGNQLKFTVGEVYDNDIVTEETGDPVEGMFGFISIQARIVNSPILIGTSAKVVELIEKKMIEDYFGK